MCELNFHGTYMDWALLVLGRVRDISKLTQVVE